MSVEGLRIWPWGGDEAGTHDSVQGGGFKPVLRPQSPVPPQKGERGGLGPGLTRPLSLGRERERERARGLLIVVPECHLRAIVYSSGETESRSRSLGGLHLSLEAGWGLVFWFCGGGASDLARIDQLRQTAQ